MSNPPVTIAVIPARLDSSRLPGKALREVNGRPLIDYVLARARRIPGVKAAIVATTTRPVDDAIVNYLTLQSVPYFRGETHDVAKRLLDCAVANAADYFVRVNGDSAFLDHHLIGEGVALCQDRQPDFVTNLPGRTFPYGIAVEIIKTETYARILPQIAEPDRGEAPTKYYYDHPEQLRVVTMTSPRPEVAKARLVVDTLEDFERFAALVEALGPDVETARYDQVAATYLELARNQP